MGTACRGSTCKDEPFPKLCGDNSQHVVFHCGCWLALGRWCEFICQRKPACSLWHTHGADGHSVESPHTLAASTATSMQGALSCCLAILHGFLSCKAASLAWFVWSVTSLSVERPAAHAFNALQHVCPAVPAAPESASKLALRQGLALACNHGWIQEFVCMLVCSTL